MEYIDPDLLRTFLAFADSGSLSRAAAAVGRTPSAITSQMRRLEDTIGSPLIEPSGRGRILTVAGEELVGHSRRILDVHRQALLSLQGARAEGRISIGATQDFAECGIPRLLRLFATTHPGVTIDLRIGRSADLSEHYANGQIDVLLTMRSGPNADEIASFPEPMVWLCSSEGLVAESDTLPLALLDAPCGFRGAALAALDARQRNYRIASTSSSVAGLRTAVEAGIAVTLRTKRTIGSGIVEAAKSLSLPETEDAVFSLRIRPEAGSAAKALADLMADGLKAGG
jgi:DNA-binding transcriptional LysR family regulator